MATSRPWPHTAPKPKSARRPPDETQPPFAWIETADNLLANIALLAQRAFTSNPLPLVTTIRTRL